MLLPDGESLASAGIFPDAIIRVSEVPRGLVLRMQPWWSEVLVMLTREQQEELAQDGLVALTLWMQGNKGVLIIVALGTAV